MRDGDGVDDVPEVWAAGREDRGRSAGLAYAVDEPGRRVQVRNHEGKDMFDEDISVADGWRISGKVIAFAAIGIVTLIAIGSMWVFGWGWAKKSTADHRGDVAATEKVLADPNYRIAQYDHFYDLCASIQGKEATIDALEQELATTPSADRVEQINATLTAVRASRASSIREYNVDARKTATAAQFRSSDLPSELDPKSEETSCAA